jgi:hypothetical protein
MVGDQNATPKQHLKNTILKTLRLLEVIIVVIAVLLLLLLLLLSFTASTVSVRLYTRLHTPCISGSASEPTQRINRCFFVRCRKKRPSCNNTSRTSVDILLHIASTHTAIDLNYWVQVPFYCVRLGLGLELR